MLLFLVLLDSVTNMFIRPETREEIENFDPDFTVINCCSQVDEDWKRHNLHSDTAVVFNPEKKTAVIFGTWVRDCRVMLLSSRS